jgi:hypothetical protein
MPSRTDVKVQFLQLVAAPLPESLQSGSAFKICDSLISCAAHKK